MKLPKSIIIFIIIIISVSCYFLSYGVSYGVSYGAPAINESADTAISMDWGLFIRERQQLADRTGLGVVMVIIYDKAGSEIARGSGFFIDRKGRIITNASIFKDAYSAEVFSESKYYDDVVILNRDKDLDVALIQVKAADEVSLELDYGYKITPGEKVIVVGKSSGSQKTYSEGIINSVKSIRAIPEFIEIKTVVSILPLYASKDGPLLNINGRVIGIMSTNIQDSKNVDVIPRMPDYQNIKAVGLDSIKPFLSRTAKTEHLKIAKSKIWTRWFINWLQTAAGNVFITLYQIGLSKILKNVFLMLVIIYIIHFSYLKLKK
ncbi:MAG: trypsin-like peptidase domain-containing protein [Nitrospirae bacterium]|nr:trypsin-like peptidase domain-containing protein [Nitrospirota bacterium]